MPYWTENDVTHANLERVGPFFDCCVGSGVYAKEYATLNAAIAAAEKFIILCPGATMDANLTIGVNGTVVWAPRGWLYTINASTYRLTIAADNCYFAGFQLIGGTGDGITVTGDANIFERVGVSGWSDDGILFSSGDLCRVEFCNIVNNGGDGIEIASGSNHHMIIPGNNINGNTGYGINDGQGTSTEGGNRIQNNTAGARNGMNYIDGQSID